MVLKKNKSMDEIEKVDVCIIGAGPSGTATSLMLSKLKISHYIIDKATFPRDKICGDGLILYAYKAMKLLGEDIFNNFLNHPKFIHSKQARLHINDTLNLHFAEAQDRNMLISYARRLDFDDFLVKHISDIYATKEFGNSVKSLKRVENKVLIKLKDGKEILSKIVVGADGAQSLVSRKLNNFKIDNKYRSTFISAYFNGVTNLKTNNEAEIRMIYKKVPMFFYIFPLSDGQVNVSLGVRSDHLFKHDINLIEEVEEIISSHKLVKNRFLEATKVSKWRGWVIPFHLRKHKIFGDQFLLVGDAAGLANAFYKEGVGTGMMSGIIAAKNIERCLRLNDFSANSLQQYETEIKKEFGKLLAFSYYILKIAKFKKIFFKAVSIFKGRVERRSFKIIQKRSY